MIVTCCSFRSFFICLVFQPEIVILVRGGTGCEAARMLTQLYFTNAIPRRLHRRGRHRSASMIYATWLLNTAVGWPHQMAGVFRSPDPAPSAPPGLGHRIVPTVWSCVHYGDAAVGWR
jgi:hypothetical protein